MTPKAYQWVASEKLPILAALTMIHHLRGAHKRTVGKKGRKSKIFFFHVFIYRWKALDETNPTRTPSTPEVRILTPKKSFKVVKTRFFAILFFYAFQHINRKLSASPERK
jgi:hypothetical protein